MFSRPSLITSLFFLFNRSKLGKKIISVLSAYKNFVKATAYQYNKKKYELNYEY